jgi:hypothetical protein
MVSSITREFVGIVKVGDKLWKACRPIGATFRDIESTAKP